MISVHLTYENGVFRPQEPVELPDGAQVEALLLTDETEADLAQVEDILDRIAALPVQDSDPVQVSRDYETILYPKSGDIP